MPKVIDREQFVQVLILHKALWRWPQYLKWKYDSNKRKVYHLICMCGKPKWVPWRKLQQGSCLGCRSCRSHLKKHGKSRTALYLCWHDLRKNKKPLVEDWVVFENFERWAKGLYEKGFKLIRIDKELPYGPENCDYVLINKRKEFKGNLLPKGFNPLEPKI